MEHFINRFFDDRAEYESYKKEFYAGPAVTGKEKLQEYNERIALDSSGGLILDAGEAIYTYIRSNNPNVIVETGVCNGFSSLFILSALEKNGGGELISVDLPRKEDTPVAEFRDQTYSEFGSEGEYALPESKSPGWVIPDRLTQRWELRLGRSQVVLPRLVSEIDVIDMFLHDSEHSIPAMLFEYESALPKIPSGGVIFSDDINWNEAIEIFEEERDVQVDTVVDQFGYIYKNE